MSKESDLRRVLDCGIVAVVRSPDSQQLVEAAQALADGGVDVVEITMTVPDALDVVRQVRRALGDRLLLGAGTILDPETARAALLAGAEYLVAPTVNLDVIRLCQRYDKLVMPGAFTPTEILTAWEAGADIVKVFPADVLGPAFFKAMRGPLPQIRLMPTGGVDLTTAADFLRAGACCLGVGGQLVEPKAVAARNFDRIRDLARRYAAVVSEFRQEEDRVNPMPHEVVTFGEAMIRLSPPNFRRLEQARSLDVQVGGAELNTAVGLARLGRSAAWVSRLTDNRSAGSSPTTPARPASRRNTSSGRRKTASASTSWSSAPPARQQRPLRPQGRGHRRHRAGHGPVGRRVPRREVVPRHRHHAGPERRRRPRRRPRRCGRRKRPG